MKGCLCLNKAHAKKAIHSERNGFAEYRNKKIKKYINSPPYVMANGKRTVSLFFVFDFVFSLAPVAHTASF